MSLAESGRRLLGLFQPVDAGILDILEPTQPQTLNVAIKKDGNGLARLLKRQVENRTPLGEISSILSGNDWSAKLPDVSQKTGRSMEEIKQVLEPWGVLFKIDTETNTLSCPLLVPPPTDEVHQ